MYNCCNNHNPAAGFTPLSKHSTGPRSPAHKAKVVMVWTKAQLCTDRTKKT
jgi:hypothetical protein